MTRLAPVATEPVPGWLVSPRFDLAFVLGPTLVAGLVALVLPANTALPEWGWVVLVLGVDVAHVWSTLYRTYLDPDERSRRPVLYAAAPLCALLVCSCLWAWIPDQYWRVMAYLAAFHFVRQAVGIGVLYRARAGLTTRDRAGRIERTALYAVTVGPLVWWHASLPLPFEWFVPGDFVAAPGWLGPLALVGTGVLVAVHLAHRVREGWRPASDLWLFGTAVAWVGGIVIARSDAAFTVSNVIAHGVPYVALVWWTAGRRWWTQGRGAVHRSLFTPAGAGLALGLLIALAFAEEALWDVLVWHERPSLFGTWDVPDWAGAAVALLSVPQVTHYLLDGFIWKLGPNNPGLAELLGLRSAQDAPGS